MIQGRNRDVTFRSKAGRGEWVLAGSLTSGITVGNAQLIKIPKNLPSDYKQRGWNGAVPALGIRARGTITPDVGVTDLKATKLQLMSHIDMLINCDLKTPYMQQREDLARLAFVGMVTNPDAEFLDQMFVDDGERPLIGVNPRDFISPDVGILGNTAKPLVTQNGNNYAGSDPRDCFWRQTEGQFLIATAVPAPSTFDFLQSFPLCAGTGSLLKDSIPLDTLCDITKPWEISLRLARDPNTTLHLGGGAGIVFTRLDVYCYIIPMRDSDPRVHGLPYMIRRQNRAQSPLQYQPGEIILCSGNFPITGDTTFVDTVNAVGYRPCIVYGDFRTDMTQGNVLEWATPGEVSRFPYWFQDRSPRHVYQSIHNSRPRHHLVRYGSSTDIVVVGGRVMAGLGYANVVDAANFTTLLGTVSPWPIRIVAESALEMEGFPGFGTLDRSCGAPYVDVTGTQDFGGTGSISAINGKQGMLDIVLNNSVEDKTYIENLGRNCCVDGSVVFAPTAANPDSEKATLIAGKITTSEEVKPNDPADVAKLSKSTGVADPVSNVAGMMKGDVGIKSS